MAVQNKKRIWIVVAIVGSIILAAAAIYVAWRLSTSDIAPGESEAAVINALKVDPDETGEGVRSYGTFLFANGSLKDEVLRFVLKYENSTVVEEEIGKYGVTETPLKAGEYTLEVYKGSDEVFVYDQDFKIYNENLVIFLNTPEKDGNETEIVHAVFTYDALPPVRIYNFTSEDLYINGGTLVSYYTDISIDRLEFLDPVFNTFTNIQFYIYASDDSSTYLEKVEDLNSKRQHLIYFVLGDSLNENTIVTAVTLNLAEEYKVEEVTPLTDDEVVDEWCAGNWYCENITGQCYNCGYSCEKSTTKCPDESALGGAGNFPEIGGESNVESSTD